MRAGFGHWDWPAICRRWAEGSIARDEAFGPDRGQGWVLIYSAYILIAVDRMIRVVGRERVAAALRRLAEQVEHDRVGELLK